MWGNLKEEAHRQIVVPFAVHAAKVLLFEFAMNWWWGDFFTVLTRKCSCMHVCCRYSGEGGGTYIFLDHISWEYYHHRCSQLKTIGPCTEVAKVVKCAASCACHCADTDTAERIISVGIGNDVIIDLWELFDHWRDQSFEVYSCLELTVPCRRNGIFPVSTNCACMHGCWYWSVQRRWRAFMDLIQWYNDIIIDDYSWEPAFDHWRAGPRFWRKQPGVIAMFWRKFLGNSKLLCYSEKTHRLWDRIRHVYTWIKALALYLTSIRLGCAW